MPVNPSPLTFADRYRPWSTKRGSNIKVNGAPATPPLSLETMDISEAVVKWLRENLARRGVRIRSRFAPHPP